MRIWVAGMFNHQDTKTLIMCVKNRKEFPGW